MKKNFAFLILIAVLGLASVAAVSARAGGDTIATIRSQYASINKNLRRYKKVKKDAPGFSAEGGTLQAYFDGNSIKKIAVRFFGEMGRADEEYYYWNDKLIFIFRRQSNYDRPLSGKVISTNEDRFYFDNGKMIRWLDQNGRQVPTSSDGYGEKEAENLDTATKLLELARS